MVETTRAEGSDKIDEAAISGLPNNGRNFLDFTKLTPGVTIVQGPDGDELSINGQKGIVNNVSVDGADFNNPFFGEQRGGQRPPFTFNLDAVKEVVVVAEGAPAEFGRSHRRLRQRGHQVRHQRPPRHVHAYFKNDGLSSAPKRADGSTNGTKYAFDQQQYGFTLGGPIKKDKVFYFVAFDYQNGSSTKQTDPSAHRAATWSTTSRASARPDENGPIDRTNDARVFLGKIDWQLDSKNLLTLRYNYTWSEQANGTFDVDSWGRSANAIEKDYSHAGQRVAAHHLLLQRAQRVPLPVRPRGPAAALRRAGHHRPEPPPARHRLRLRAASYRFGEPFFIPVDVLRQRFQFNDNLSLDQGPAHASRSGVELNCGQERPDLRRLRQRPLHLRLDRRAS